VIISNRPRCSVGSVFKLAEPTSVFATRLRRNINGVILPRCNMAGDFAFQWPRATGDSSWKLSFSPQSDQSSRSPSSRLHIASIRFEPRVGKPTSPDRRRGEFASAKVP
jgi:hypothetical protein